MSLIDLKYILNNNNETMVILFGRKFDFERKILFSSLIPSLDTLGGLFKITLKSRTLENFININIH